MASSVVTCPKCDKKFKTKTDMAGKRIRCPGCTKVFTVPGVEEPAPTAAAPPPALPPLAFEEEENDNPYAVKEQHLKARCPNCANEMADEHATICLYCGYNTLTREWGKTAVVIGNTAGDYFMHLLPGILSFLGAVLVACVLLYYCLVSPITFKGNRWLEWTDHESLRMWGTFITMFIMWGSGYFAYKRLLVEPKPFEIKKE